MPLSMVISLVVATLGVVVYGLYKGGGAGSPPVELYTSVGVNFFNITAIFCLFATLIWHGKSQDTDFGKVVRKEMPTIVVALFVTGISTAHGLLVHFDFLVKP